MTKSHTVPSIFSIVPVCATLKLTSWYFKATGGAQCAVGEKKNGTKSEQSGRAGALQCKICILAIHQVHLRMFHAFLLQKNANLRSPHRFIVAVILQE